MSSPVADRPKSFDEFAAFLAANGQTAVLDDGHGCAIDTWVPTPKASALNVDTRHLVGRRIPRPRSRHRRPMRRRTAGCSRSAPDDPDPAPEPPQRVRLDDR